MSYEPEEDPVETVRKSLKLEPGQGQVLDLGRLVPQAAQAQWATLDLEWEGNGEDLLAYSWSILPEGRQAVRNPLVDPAEERAQSSNYPWFLSEGTNSRILIKNPGSEPRRLVAHLFAQDGTEYDFGGMELLPGQLKEFDLGRIQAEGTPDSFGRTLPPGELSGQFVWFPWQKPYDLVGRVVVEGQAAQRAVSLSCFQCNVNNPGTLTARPSSINLAVGSTQQLAGTLSFKDCSGQTTFSTDVTLFLSVTSDDENVAVPQPGSKVYMYGPGSTTVRCAVEVEKSLCLMGCAAETFPITKFTSVPTTAVSIEALSVDARDPRNTRLNYRITPAGASVFSATFTGGSTSITTSNLNRDSGGNLSFGFDQESLDHEGNDIKLNYTVAVPQLPKTVNVTGTKSRMNVTSQNSYTQRFFVEPNLLVPIDIGITHKVAEIFDKVTYSVPVITTSKIIKLIESTASVNVADNPVVDTDIATLADGTPLWGESHFFEDSLGEQLFGAIMQDIPLSEQTLPPQTSKHRFKRVDEDGLFPALYFFPAQMKGAAQSAGFGPTLEECCASGILGSTVVKVTIQ